MHIKPNAALLEQMKLVGEIYEYINLQSNGLRSLMRPIDVFKDKNWKHIHEGVAKEFDTRPHFKGISASVIRPALVKAAGTPYDIRGDLNRSIKWRNVKLSETGGSRKSYSFQTGEYTENEFTVKPWKSPTAFDAMEAGIKPDLTIIWGKGNFPRVRLFVKSSKVSNKPADTLNNSLTKEIDVVRSDIKEIKYLLNQVIARLDVQ